MAGRHDLFSDYLTKSEFCRAIPGKPISGRTADRWDERRVGPPRIRCGNLILYPKAAVKAWLEKRLAEAEGRIESVAVSRRGIR